MRRKTTESLEIENTLFVCEIVKIITEENGHTSVELDSVLLKHCEAEKNPKTIVKMRGSEAQAFLDICTQIAGVFAPRSVDVPSYLSSSAPPHQTSHIITENGEEVTIKHEPVNRPGGYKVNQYENTIKTLDAIAKKQHGVVEDTRTFSEQAGIESGLTEDQLTPEQRAIISEKYGNKLNAMYPDVRGAHINVNADIKNPHEPPSRKGPSKLKQMRDQKLYGRQ